MRRLRRSSESFPSAATGESDLFQALEQLKTRYRMKLVGATLGCHGVLALTDECFLYERAYSITCRDTTGAGDVFHGAFIYGLLQNWPMRRVLDFSCAMAGLNCAAVGAGGGIATEAAAERLMATGRRLPPRWRQLPRLSPTGAGR